MLILPPEKKLQIGQNNPKNQRTLSYARGLFSLEQNSMGCQKIIQHRLLRT